MNKNNANQTQKKTLKKRCFIVGAIGVMILAFIVLYTLMLQPGKSYPLGDKLEYVGASYSGSLPFLSDSNPSASYYYSTDLSVKELIQYFKKASVKDDSDLALTHPPTEPIYFSLQATTTNNPISVYYYVDGSEKTSDFKLRQTSKKHLIIIQSENYQTAKDAL